MKSILFILIICLNASAFGQKRLHGSVVSQEKEPFAGALVYLPASRKSITTDAQGHFEILRDSARDTLLIVSYISYPSVEVTLEPDTEEITVIMDEDPTLKEVVITGRTSPTVKSSATLFQTERITIGELQRAACCNLSESFETNPSVDVTYSDAVTGAKQIQLLGLSGKYVQTLTENYPNFRGPASVYGLDYIPGPWMESISISKGAASVKNGYESVSGQLNVEYKKPGNSDPLSVNLFASDAGRYEGNADAAFALNDKWYTGILTHYSTEVSEHDGNGDTFLDMPKKHQFNLLNRWHYTSGRYGTQFGARFIQDNRTSGQTHQTVPDDLYAPYEIEVKSNRAEFFTKNSFFVNPDRNGNLALIFTGSYQEQKSRYNTTLYNVYASNLYGSLMYETRLSESHHLGTGLSLNWDRYAQTFGQPDLGGSQLESARSQPERETTTGAYAEYTFTSGPFVASGGIRADYSTLHRHAFVTPRVHLKYMPADWVNLRASAGKGYRTVFVLPENSFYLASSRKLQIASDLKQESAWNYGLSAGFYLPVAGRELTLSAEWYYTNFVNQVVTDLDTDAHAVKFYNSRKSYAHSIQFEASYPLFRGFTVLGAYRWMQAKSEIGGVLRKTPLTSDYKALLTASYETRLRKWVFDFTTQFNGGGRMPAPEATHPLWEETFRSFTILNAQITRNFKQWAVYVGGENLTDFTQKNPVISAENPYSPDFDATMVWGPTLGRKFYVGFRWHL